MCNSLPGAGLEPELLSGTRLKSGIDITIEFSSAVKVNNDLLGINLSTSDIGSRNTTSPTPSDTADAVSAAGSSGSSGSSGSLTSLGSLFSATSSRSPSPELLEADTPEYRASNQRWFARNTQDKIYSTVYETYKLRNSAYTIHSYYLSGLKLNDGPRIEVVSAAFTDIRNQFNITTTEFNIIRDCTDEIFDSNGRLTDTRLTTIKQTISESLGRAEAAENRASRVHNLIFKPSSTTNASTSTSTNSN